MIMTELQYASLVISLSTLGQTTIEGMDTEQLRNLDYLLEAARENVQKVLAHDPEEERRRYWIEQQNEDRRGWLNMSNGEEIP